MKLKLKGATSSKVFCLRVLLEENQMGQVNLDILLRVYSLKDLVFSVLLLNILILFIRVPNLTSKMTS